MPSPKQSLPKRPRTNFFSLPRELRHQILNYTFAEFENMFVGPACVNNWTQALIKADVTLYEDAKFLGYRRLVQILDNHDEKNKNREHFLKGWY